MRSISEIQLSKSKTFTFWIWDKTISKLFVKSWIFWGKFLLFLLIALWKSNVKLSEKNSEGNYVFFFCASEVTDESVLLAQLHVVQNSQFGRVIIPHICTFLLKQRWSEIKLSRGIWGNHGFLRNNGTRAAFILTKWWKCIKYIWTSSLLKATYPPTNSATPHANEK